LLGLFDRTWEGLILNTQPLVQAPAPAVDPFVLPFIIKNRSTAFAMKDVEWGCRIDRVFVPPPQNYVIENVVIQLGRSLNIPPSGTALGH
jgi:hypothetical protein